MRITSYFEFSHFIIGEANLHYLELVLYSGLSSDRSETVTIINPTRICGNHALVFSFMKPKMKGETASNIPAIISIMI